MTTTITYVTNVGGDSVSVIYLATNAVSATIAVGAAPWGVAVNPAGTLAYVTNQTGNTVSVIDLATNTVTATLAVGATRPSHIASAVGRPVGTRIRITKRVARSMRVSIEQHDLPELCSRRHR